MSSIILTTYKHVALRLPIGCRTFAITGRHSKNVAKKKNKLDDLKSKARSRMSLKIMMAARAGGVDPSRNVDLARALKEAHGMKIPNDNIERALKNATDSTAENYTAGIYEVFGHGGVGIIVSTLTSSAARTIADIKLASKKAEVKVASPNSVLFQFNHKGYFQPNSPYSADLVLVAAIEDDLDEIDFVPNAENDDENEEPDTILTDIDLVGPLQDVMDRLGIEGTSGLTYIPQTHTKVSQNDFERNVALIESLEGLEGVDTVYHNMDEENSNGY